MVQDNPHWRLMVIGFFRAVGVMLLELLSGLPYIVFILRMEIILSQNMVVMRPSDNEIIQAESRIYASVNNQAIIWTSAGLLINGPLETHLSKNWIKIQQF